jgi:glycosyltransferase involved in cell wall biosynthesis
MVDVSVIITCYNYGRYLTEAIDSVLKQTYRNYEVIIINDGSTDNSDDIINSYVIQSNKIRYYKQNNQGQARAKNKGIQMSLGKYVAFLDADDIWKNDIIEKRLLLFKDENVGVVFTKADYIDRTSKRVKLKLSGKYLVPSRGNVTKKLIFDNFVPFSSAMVRNECFFTIGMFDEKLEMAIDWDLWLRISTKYQFDFVGEHLLLYRVGHEGQLSRNIEKRLVCIDKILQKFATEYPQILPWKIYYKKNSYSYYNRGIYFSKKDLDLSNKYFKLAIQSDNKNLMAYLGLIKNYVFKRYYLIKNLGV